MRHSLQNFSLFNFRFVTDGKKPLLKGMHFLPVAAGVSWIGSEEMNRLLHSPKSQNSRHPCSSEPDLEFTEFLDLNKINHAKAEPLKSKKDGRVLSS